MTDPEAQTDPEIAERAWQLAAARMSKGARVIFRMRAKGWSYERMQRRTGISRRSITRAMIEAVSELARAFEEAEGGG